MTVQSAKVSADPVMIWEEIKREYQHELPSADFSDLSWYVEELGQYELALLDFLTLCIREKIKVGSELVDQIAEACRPWHDRGGTMVNASREELRKNGLLITSPS